MYSARLQNMMPNESARDRHITVHAVIWPLLISLALYSTPARADRLALWTIVHDRCAANLTAGNAPDPCASIDPAKGVAILKDQVGIAQYLAIPTSRITGIEDPQLLQDNAPDIWGAAWAARGLLDAKLGHALARDAVAIAVNSSLNRSQDQLHLHIDCLAPDVAEALSQAKNSLDVQWRLLPAPLKGLRYWARRVDSAELAGVWPFRMLADELSEAKGQMGRETLVAAGITYVPAQPGFVLLAQQGDLGGGGHGENLQDHDCAIAH